MTFRCKVCEQPIPREMAVKTAAGHFTNGYCDRHRGETVDATWPPADKLVQISNSEEKGGENERSEIQAIEDSQGV